jgi:hypothetical protein
MQVQATQVTAPKNVIKITHSLEHHQKHTFTRTIFDKSPPCDGQTAVAKWLTYQQNDAVLAETYGFVAANVDLNRSRFKI